MPGSLFSLLLAALLFIIVLVLFYPDRGLLAWWRRARRNASRILIEDALKHLQRCETHNSRSSIQSLAGALNISINHAALILNKLAGRQLIYRQAGDFNLTPAGREYALRVIRAHRLWEHYLAEETGFAQSEWHEQAEHQEHMLTLAQAEALSAHLGHPTHDPHGDPIPSAGGFLQHHGGASLADMPLDVPLRIVHIEDEPEAVYAQILAEDLHPGMQVRLTERSPQRLRFWAGTEEHLLAPVVAANISVVPLRESQETPEKTGMPLSGLNLGESGRVASLSPASRGAERRRLLDLGLVPGTTVQAEFRSPAGDPTAYRVRGALIALRREQADQIQIAPLPAVES